jgi:hypothetical protein
MISVQLPDEPPDFDQRVRAEGLAHLQEQNQDPDQPRINASIWKERRLPDGTSQKPDYWRRARDSIKSGYSNRCVYTCFKLEDEIFPGGDTLAGQVDHFKPRESSAARLAYEWGNLRWAWAKIDSEYKKNNIIPDDHDPIRIDDGLMMLEEDDNGHLLVIPNPSLSDSEKMRLGETIRMLGLNRTPVKQARKNCFEHFIEPSHSYDHDFIEETQPFIYQQMFT